MTWNLAFARLGAFIFLASSLMLAGFMLVRDAAVVQNSGLIPLTIIGAFVGALLLAITSLIKTLQDINKELSQ